ncbi:hypothetical protein DWQ65_04380 [Treponema phagedenis]|uniref:Flagellar protein FlgN n=1 Tax=Treponema phagedenis TaxID=162 RepID=A0A0B7GVJ3_TREPH|nr:flagellar export chaperone FlgN [Treponema phagedenis]NVP22945.1 hypothetical protein [Treponema phagedenis]QEJ95066.1 hypothetical protein FUT79_07545 [Treponema phagedenis]QEJ98260.1 hypothetical protein FUT82_09795 [Treponema phagedenis]QEK00991.1 hypothetical protein FUT84_07390 [Treponema phagedenis]QEK03771.1 hypothetical protein FUT83_08105 [Treponema phagedenis]
MEPNAMIENLTSILNCQIETITKLTDVQQKMYAQVRSRSWEGIEGFVARAENLAREFSTLDKQCFLALQKINPYSDEPVDFETFIAQCTKEDAAELRKLYADLKRKVFRSKIENDVFNTYVGHARSLMEGMVDAVITENKTAFYTNTGAPTSAPAGSFLIDKSF